MRIPMSCLDCINERLAVQRQERAAAIARGETPALPVYNLGKTYLADIKETNAYVETCENGHTMTMTLQNVRYELLYESGIVATLVGFHRESVSSVASALERFYEFAIEVFTHHAKVPEAQHEAAWKQLKKQSERQLGAFMMLYLTTFSRPFLTVAANKLFADMTTFRNNCIHQGYFPSKEEARAYAKFVFDLIRDARAELQALDPDAVHEVFSRHTRDGLKAIQDAVGVAGANPDLAPAWHTMMMSPFNAAETTMTFEARLADAAATLDHWGFPNVAPDL